MMPDSYCLETNKPGLQQSPQQLQRGTPQQLVVWQHSPLSNGSEIVNAKRVKANNGKIFILGKKLSLMTGMENDLNDI